MCLSKGTSSGRKSESSSQVPEPWRESVVRSLKVMAIVVPTASLSRSAGKALGWRQKMLKIGLAQTFRPAKLLNSRPEGARPGVCTFGFPAGR